MGKSIAPLRFRKKKKKKKKRSRKTSPMPSSNRFFKIVLRSAFYEHKLKIPEAFVKKYGGELSNSVKITVPTGGIWYVKAEKVDKAIWLHEGLQKFMADHSVGFGYVLMFKYKGSSTFRVNIFNLAASEIEYHDEVNRFQVSEHDEKDGDDDSSVEFLGSSTNHQCPRKSEQSSGFVFGNAQSTAASHESWNSNRYNLRRRFSKQDRLRKNHECQRKSVQASRCLLENEKSSAASDESRKSNRYHLRRRFGMQDRLRICSNRKRTSCKRNSESSNIGLPQKDSYKIILKPYSISSRILHLPNEFCRSYLSSGSQFIKLRDVDDYEWDVRCVVPKAGGCALSKGWCEFAQAKELIAGDVCVFEPMIIDSQLKLKVKISRAMGPCNQRYLKIF